mgnify:CR=1 FL=1
MSLFDAFWLCGNPGSQMKTYYKSGQYKDCMVYLTDWGKCLQMKSTSDPAKRQKLRDGMTTLPEVAALVSPAADGFPYTGQAHASAEIWELEERPCWVKAADRK